MKRLTTFMMIAAFAGMVACSSDTTEIAWVNSDQSATSINRIVWANGDQTWIDNAGYANNNTQTESKEVKRLAGTVECDIFDGTNYIPIIINSINGDTTLNSLVLKEGSSEVFVLEVN